MTTQHKQMRSQVLIALPLSTGLFCLAANAMLLNLWRTGGMSSYPQTPRPAMPAAGELLRFEGLINALAVVLVGGNGK